MVKISVGKGRVVDKQVHYFEKQRVEFLGLLSGFSASSRASGPTKGRYSSSAGALAEVCSHCWRSRGNFDTPQHNGLSIVFAFSRRTIVSSSGRVGKRAPRSEQNGITSAALA